MAFDYTSSKALSVEMIRNYGRQMTFQKMSATAVDPAKPWNGPAAPTVGTQIVLYAVAIPAWGLQMGTFGVDEEMLRRVDMVLIVEPYDSDTLDDYHVVLDGNQRYKREWFQRLAPGTTNLLGVWGVKR